MAPALLHHQLPRLLAAAATAALIIMTRMMMVSASHVPTIAFDDGFTPLFGEAMGNMERSPDGRTVRLTLNRYSGSGFISSHYYHHGFFSAAIKLPNDHTAGVVVAFYLSNGDVFEKKHDELDFEFLGNRRRHEWRLQTNVYGNGSTDRGREERYLMPFDPTAEAHRFSILWSSRVVIFYVDGVAVREVPRSGAMGGDYPSKPMALYATIWDGSTWATDNGRYKVNYKHGPFTADFSDLVLRGCPAAAVRHDDPAALQLQLVGSSADDRCAGAEFELMTADYAIMTARKRMEMRRWRQRQMLYTVCYDTNRYPAPFPECDVNMAERQKFWEWGESKVVRPRVRGRSSGRRRTATPAPQLVSLQQAD
ncbi:putative xyloglucan endotransglucosylase/hydrolase protein 30 [Dichanthelium oligosanthes]|uniref:Xyloglucan endotransglucosylase/hydrolase n=1 Tax=Dichanthelium oligosanthes TaxID=888268 RepID=A0A1E5W447_9POAL|nr:putative xyloglucan endotransglucosylase/hydrolase protein 30 [Dichanthelium oligosanthes]